MRPTSRAAFSAATYPFPSTFGAGSTGHGNILWKPAGGGDAKTWADVMSFVNATECPFAIFVEGNGAFPGTDLIIPPSGTPYDLHNCWFESPFGSPRSNVVLAQDRAQLLNLSKVSGGCGLFGEPTVEPTLLYTPPSGIPPVILAEKGAAYGNGGTRALMDAPNLGAGGPSVVFAVAENAGFVGISTAPLIALAPGAQGLVYVIDAANQIAPNFISGDATTTLIVVGTSGATWDLTNGNFGLGVGFGSLGPGFTGTIINLPQTVVGGSGPHTFRPTTGPSIPPVGCMYYQTDATGGLTPGPIWWKGAAWVDSAGTPV